MENTDLIFAFLVLQNAELKQSGLFKTVVRRSEQSFYCLKQTIMTWFFHSHSNFDCGLRKFRTAVNHMKRDNMPYREMERNTFFFSRQYMLSRFIWLTMFRNFPSPFYSSIILSNQKEVEKDKRLACENIVLTIKIFTFPFL